MGKTRHRVHFRKENVTLEVIEGTNLRQACLDNGIDPYPWLKGLLSCRGKGFCGTCLVRVDEPSALGEPSKREAKWLKRRHGEVWEKMRLSCQSVVEGDGLGPAAAVIDGAADPGRYRTELWWYREVFAITKVGKIAGCRVVDGLIRRGARLRLLRDDVVIYEGALASLKRFKDDAREVREGFECGIGIEGYNDIREGDVIEAFEIEEVARSL